MLTQPAPEAGLDASSPAASAPPGCSAVQILPGRIEEVLDVAPCLFPRDRGAEHRQAGARFQREVLDDAHEDPHDLEAAGDGFELDVEREWHPLGDLPDEQSMEAWSVAWQQPTHRFAGHLVEPLLEVEDRSCGLGEQPTVERTPPSGTQPNPSRPAQVVDNAVREGRLDATGEEVSQQRRRRCGLRRSRAPSTR